MVEIEQTVIGCLVLDFKGCGDIAVDVMPEWFENALYQKIMERIKSLHDRNITPDSMTIIDGVSEDVKREVMYCITLVPSVSNFPNYVDQLKTAWRKRTVENRIQGIALEGVSDVDETIEELRAIVSEQDEITASSSGEVGKKFIESAADFCSGLSKDVKKYSSGYPLFDNTTGGLLPTTVCVLAARPGQGKTDFALSLMMKYAARGYKLIYYSLEMSEHQIMTRISAQVTGINNTRIRDHKFNGAEHADICRAFGIVSGNENIRLVYEAPTIAKLRQDVKSSKPDIIFIDHLALMKMPKRSKRVEEVTETTRALKRLALDTGVTVVELVQMNREVEKRKGSHPTLSDLKESGSIEEDADYVAFIHADKGEKQHLTGNEAFQTMIYIEKNRHGGTGVVRFAWRPQYSRFSEVDGIHEYKG